MIRTKHMHEQVRAKRKGNGGGGRSAGAAYKWWVVFMPRDVLLWHVSNRGGRGTGNLSKHVVEGKLSTSHVTCWAGGAGSG